MENKGINTSIGLLDILGLIFITLKLTEFISWSWWIVLLPFYPIFIAIFLLITLGITVLVSKLFKLS